MKVRDTPQDKELNAKLGENMAALEVEVAASCCMVYPLPFPIFM